MNPKALWFEKIKIQEAKTVNGQMYFLLDENYDFIPFTKEFLQMIQSKSMSEVSPNTIKTYCYLLRYFIIFLKMNDLQILDLDGKPHHLTEFKLWLKNPYRFHNNIEVLNYDFRDTNHSDELSVKTINAIISRVSSLYLWLKASGKIVDNPVIYLDVLMTNSMKDKMMLSHTNRKNTIQLNALKTKEPITIPKTIDYRSFDNFLSSLNLLRDKIIVLILKEGGLRASELLGIRIEDIDFAEQGIWVRFRSANSNGARAKAGQNRDRFVHLPMDLMTLIDRYISGEWIESDPNEDFLFVVLNSKRKEQNGKPMTKSTLDSMFKNYCKKAQVSLTPHQLRHTHATELVRNYIDKGENINWEYISKRLGHSSVTTTIGTYVHLSTEDYKKEYARMTNYKSNKKKGDTNE